MACHQQLYWTFVYVLMSLITGCIGGSCPAGRQTVDICTQGTVHASETLLVNFSPEAGIGSCNCNLTIDGTSVNVTSLMAPQSECGPQLEVELGVDYLEVDCNPVNKSYDTSEVKNGIIWTTADVFFSGAQPQDMCLEFNVHGGQSTLSISCYVERDWEPSTTDPVSSSPTTLPSTSEVVTPGTPPPEPSTEAVTVSSGALMSTASTTDISTDTIPLPPDHIRQEILKLAQNDENPVLFENDQFLFNATESPSDATTIEATTSARFGAGIITSGTPSGPVFTSSTTSATTSGSVITSGTTSDTTSGPTLPPKDIMDKILESANGTSNPIHIELPSTTIFDNVTSDDIFTTTSPEKPTETPDIPMVPPTDIRNQLLDIANNFTNDTIVFSEFPVTEIPENTTFPVTEIPESTTSSLQPSQSIIVTDFSSTERTDVTMTTQGQQTTIFDSSTTAQPVEPPTNTQQQQSSTSVKTSSIPQTTDSIKTTSTLESVIETTPMTTVAETTVSETTPTTTVAKTTVTKTTPKQGLESTTTFSFQSSTGYDHTTFDEAPLDSNGGDWISFPDSTTKAISVTTQPVKTAPRGDIEISTEKDTAFIETTSTSAITDSTPIIEAKETTTLPSTDDVTGAQNSTSPNEAKGTEDTLVVMGYVLIIVGAIIGIIVIVAIIAIIRAFCKSRRKSANITMMEKGGLENGSGATTGIDNPLVQLQQEQEMVETNPNPVNNQSGTDQNNGKMEANFSEGATEINGNGVSNSPQALDNEVFQSSENN